ncbi:1539_t:CDS:2 [Paraglomus brasilianum]|uniref:Deoxyuridine 5'-triphosphate nucleotidohydrolase n=1 Tax=Paraglomus brasilianum TaxID=144538 RepID=A0A9N8WGE1_9GLOM|nr:1539_t:CDS:2 [Paraglomus brasilianum]
MEDSSSEANNCQPLLVKRMNERARLPTRSSPNAIGYDVYSSTNVVVPARGRALVPTDLSIRVPDGTCGRIAPRSGLALDHFLDCEAGVIDADYRKPLSIMMFNFGDEDYIVVEGERIAQIILGWIDTPPVVEVCGNSAVMLKKHA